jgi:hypothetical protein
MEAVPGFPAFRAACRCCRPAIGSGTVRRQSSSASWREINAAQTRGRSRLHGHVGRFLHGLGDEFDADKLEAYPPGAVIILPGNTSHFHWAKSGEYITQVSAIGPLGLEYVNSSDDPRN